MRSHTRGFFPEPVAAKVPEITLLFWVIKILTTAGGEATSDYLALDLGSRLVAGCIEAGIFVVALVWQFRTRRYVAAAYWLLAYAIAIFGTGVTSRAVRSDRWPPRLTARSPAPSRCAPGSCR